MKLTPIRIAFLAAALAFATGCPEPDPENDGGTGGSTAGGTGGSTGGGTGGSTGGGTGGSTGGGTGGSTGGGTGGSVGGGTGGSTGGGEGGGTGGSTGGGEGGGTGGSTGGGEGGGTGGSTGGGEGGGTGGSTGGGTGGGSTGGGEGGGTGGSTGGGAGGSAGGGTGGGSTGGGTGGGSTGGGEGGGTGGSTGGGTGGGGSTCQEITVADFEALAGFAFGGSVAPSLGDTATEDYSQLEFYNSDASGTFDLGTGLNDNYSDCQQCVRVFQDEANPAIATTKQFFQSGGSINIASSDFTNGYITATLTDVTLIEVTIESGTFISTPVDGGECLHIASATVLVEAPEVPTGWICPPGYYGDGFCDCGCGAFDSDCTDTTISACQFCEDGCNPSGVCPGLIDPANTAICLTVPPVPTGWSCLEDFWGDGFCDCGCDVTDFDCGGDTSLAACQFCEGTCNTIQECPGLIDPTNNAVCVGPNHCFAEATYDNGSLEEPVAALFDDGTNNGIRFIGDLNDHIDYVYGELRDGVGLFATGIAPMSYPLTGAETDPATCGLCLTLFTDFQGSPNQEYFQTGGLVEITQAGPVLELTFFNVTFAAENACTTAIQLASFSAQIPGFGMPPEWTCSPNWYDDGEECDCGCGTLDPDCASADVGVCDYCLGCSSAGGCPGIINPTNNAVCISGGPGEDCTDPVNLPLTLGTQTVSGTTAGYGHHVGASPSQCPGTFNSSSGNAASGPDTVYQVAIPADHTLKVSVAVTGTTYDPMLYLTAVCSPSASACAASSDDTPGVYTPAIEYYNGDTGSATYFLVIDSWYGNQSGPFTLTVTLEAGDTTTPPPPPDGPCCSATTTPGCSADLSIEACVCAEDDYCCDEEWDTACVALVTSACGGVCN